MTDQAPQKIVFFDMDGPVCNRRTHMAMAPSVGAIWRECDPVAIQFFNRLYMTDPQQTRFVCCSDWRENKDRDWMQEFLSNAGWIGKFHNDWETPIRHTSQNKGHGHDVNAWLSNHHDVTAWVAIDDSRMGYPESGHLAKADLENGLTLDNMRDAFLFLHRIDMLTASKLWQHNYAVNNFG